MYLSNLSKLKPILAQHFNKHWAYRYMKISEQGIPANSKLYFAIFSFSPRWIKLLFHIRNKIVGLFGLRGPSYKNLHNIKRKSEYRIGEMVGVFKLYSLE
jgi:hypothetical protein